MSSYMPLTFHATCNVAFDFQSREFGSMKDSRGEHGNTIKFFGDNGSLNTLTDNTK